MNAPAKIIQNVKDYYGRVLKNKKDLRTSICCPTDSVLPHVKPILKLIHEEVKDKFYGCGSPVPPVLEGQTILDLGCGTGRDCFLFSQLVGPQGRVIGVDMTDEQLAIANKYVDYHTQQFGLEKPNVEFHKGYIEDLGSVDIADASVDLVVSNCVFNLSPEKERLFKEVFRVLKPGGELYFSDVFTGRRVPDHLRNDPVLIGECLGGAMYVEDFRRLLRQAGVLDARVISKTHLHLNNPEIEKKAGMIDFYSMTVRTFKCDFEDICENYGHVACYQGTIAETPRAFILDDHHQFDTGLPVPVCGNTAKMLMQTRFREHFKVTGDFSTHHGPFDCGSSRGAGSSSETGSNNGACC